MAEIVADIVGSVIDRLWLFAGREGDCDAAQCDDKCFLHVEFVLKFVV